MNDTCLGCYKNPIDPPGIYCKQCLEEAIEDYGRYLDKQLQNQGKSPEALEE